MDHSDNLVTFQLEESGIRATFEVNFVDSIRGELIDIKEEFEPVQTSFINDVTQEDKTGEEVMLSLNCETVIKEENFGDSQIDIKEENLEGEIGSEVLNNDLVEPLTAKIIEIKKETLKRET